MVESQNKYKRWVMTIQYGKTMFLGSIQENYLPSAEEVYECMKIHAVKYALQKEVTPTTGKDHYQVCFETKIRKRHSTLLKEIASQLYYCDNSGIQLDRMQGSWDEAVAYCTKEDTRKEGTVPIFSPSILEPYKGSDIDFLADETRRYPWQRELFKILFKEVPNALHDPDGRTVIWITDTEGNTGKSKLVKYCCYHNDSITKISFGSAGQLRSAIVSAGPKRCYFIDMPRTLGTDDSVNNIITAVEDIVNGFVVGNFYGKHSVMMCEPPHVVIFSNKECPEEKLSGDRWRIFYIVDKKLLESKYGQFYRLDM